MYTSVDEIDLWVGGLAEETTGEIGGGGRWIIRLRGVGGKGGYTCKCFLLLLKYCHPPRTLNLTEVMKHIDFSFWCQFYE